MESTRSSPPVDGAALLAQATFDPDLSVDGLVPGGVSEPESAEEVAAILAECQRRHVATVPVGGGTALALGNLPERVDLALSTRRLGGVIDYEPTDLVLSVGAGARLGDVQAVLAEHGQTLPIDPPGGGEATIGGLIATGLAGPRRLGHGTLRDLLIGIAVAHPSGTVTRAGGMVVKNVSGFDLPRVYHGSLGTLGVIVSANFKVLPLPRHERTLLAAYDGLPAALAAGRRVAESRLRPTALEVMHGPGAWGVAVRFEGRPDTAELLDRQARDLLAEETWTLQDADSAGWWRDYLRQQDLRVKANQALLRLNVRPREVETLATGLDAALATMGVAAPYVAVSVGLGQVIARVELDPAEGPARLPEIHAVAGALADHAVVLAAPPAWKRDHDVWGPEPDTIDLMHALRAQYDPGRVLNPGRFVGSL